MIKKFGFQAYTIRDYMKDAELTDLAFRKMKALGYDGPITIEREIKGDQQIADIQNARDLLRGVFETLED